MDAGMTACPCQGCEGDEARADGNEVPVVAFVHWQSVKRRMPFVAHKGPAFLKPFVVLLSTRISAGPRLLIVL